MKRKAVTTYTLRNQSQGESISGSTILRLQNNESVSTNTLNTLCKILGCGLADIIEYIPD